LLRIDFARVVSFVAIFCTLLNRWVIKDAPEVEKSFRHQQQPMGKNWRMDETSVKIKGKWAYLYRAVDTEGHTIDFLLIPTRDRDAAEAFLHKAIRILDAEKRGRERRGVGKIIHPEIGRLCGREDPKQRNLWHHRHP
jgi:transposase-like protein